MDSKKWETKIRFAGDLRDWEDIEVADCSSMFYPEEWAASLLEQLNRVVEVRCNVVGSYQGHYYR